MRESIVSLTEFKSSASQQIRTLKDHAEPLVLTQNGRATAVVEDYAQYQRQQKSLALLRLMVQGENDIQHGRLTPQSKVFDHLKKRLNAEKEND
ncbi:MAG: prevent-host-death protein [Zetaproteobacteria bacterium CG1_02_53_45]|nr:MAG: prevent-host-death protein [Zetaproteobacteria bacterium CG1_02_53_45]